MTMMKRLVGVFALVVVLLMSVVAFADDCNHEWLVDGGWRLCLVCGAVEEVPEAKPCDHKWDIDTPKCEETTVKLCTVCGAVETVPAAGHKWDTQAPTCADDGMRICTVCGKVEELPAAHKWDIEPATCTTAGAKLCLVCGEAEDLPALGHDLTVVVGTCTTDGVETCKVCDYKKVTPAPGHKVEVLAAVEPTCTEAGLTEGSKCTVCGEVLVAQNVVEKLGHRYRTTVVEPTTEMRGFHLHTCRRCGKSYQSNWVDKLPAVTATPVEGLGDIVLNAAMEVVEYTAVCETEGAVKTLIVTVADGAALKHLVLSNELLAKLAMEGYTGIRFVVGAAELEVTMALATDANVQAIALNEAATGVMFTIDPTVAAENQLAAVLTAEARNTDIMAFIAELVVFTPAK